MGGMDTPRAWFNEAHNMPENWGKASAETIVRNMRRKIAATGIQPGERKAWFNLQMMTTASAVAMGRANETR